MITAPMAMNQVMMPKIAPIVPYVLLSEMIVRAAARLPARLAPAPRGEGGRQLRPGRRLGGGIPGLHGAAGWRAPRPWGRRGDSRTPRRGAGLVHGPLVVHRLADAQGAGTASGPAPQWPDHGNRPSRPCAVGDAVDAGQCDQQRSPMRHLRGGARPARPEADPAGAQNRPGWAAPAWSRSAHSRWADRIVLGQADPYLLVASPSPLAFGVYRGQDLLSCQPPRRMELLAPGAALAAGPRGK